MSPYERFIYALGFICLLSIMTPEKEMQRKHMADVVGNNPETTVCEYP